MYSEGSHKLPRVNLDSEKGLIELSGRSLPENPLKFYEPMIEWLDKYKNQPKEKTMVIVKLEYVNSSSYPLLLKFFRMLETLNQDDADVKVEWYYEIDDSTMAELALDFQSILEIPMDLKQVESL